ncbi:MAG TPA: Rossmann-like and DUF2520 domain-containing protein [Rhodocyclaceae bacterium]|nr:Rossmann-like and DUF2520 domain-containing protein [Rhodocyclaceae bacterium]
MPTLSFIGCGKLGRSLGHLFHRHEVFVPRQILTRGSASAAEAVRFIGAGQPITDPEALLPADVFMLAVPDTALAETAERLSRSHVLDDRSTVFHCSGAQSSTLLAACAAQGAHIASVHPLLSFAEPAQVVRDFHCHCSIEGDAGAVSMLSLAFSRIGAEVINIPTESKLRYHAAAVIASNYLVTLTEQALQAIEGAGLTREQGRELLLPLMHQTLGNLDRLDPRDALTGPAARGDWALVEAQQNTLDQIDPRLGCVYMMLAKATARLAGKQHPFKDD